LAAATFYSTVFQLELHRNTGAHEGINTSIVAMAMTASIQASSLWRRRHQYKHRRYSDMHDVMKLSSSIAIPVTCLRNSLPLAVALASRDDGLESCCGVQGLM
jgi:hypothetical protein